MKLTAVALILFGLLAAGAAAVLVVTLKFERPAAVHIIKEPETADVLVASRALQASETVDADCVERQPFPKAEIPEGAVLNYADVVGQALIAPVVKGEVFRKHQFAYGQEGFELVTIIPQGQRAYTINVSAGDGIVNLLYPGCYVDVIANFKLPNLAGESRPEAISATLLQRVQVVTVGNRTIVDDPAEDTDAESGNRWLTIIATPEEAEVLSLAASLGDLSVTLRNPLDVEQAAVYGTPVSRLSSDLARRIAELMDLDEARLVPLQPGVAQTTAEQQAEAEGMHVPAGTTQETAAARTTTPKWITTILRGAARETREFDWPEADDSNRAQEQATPAPGDVARRD